MISQPFEHTEPIRVPVGGQASDRSIMVLRVELPARSLVLWSQTPRNDPPFIIDEEIVEFGV